MMAPFQLMADLERAKEATAKLGFKLKMIRAALQLYYTIHDVSFRRPFDFGPTGYEFLNGAPPTFHLMRFFDPWGQLFLFELVRAIKLPGVHETQRQDDIQAMKSKAYS